MDNGEIGARVRVWSEQSGFLGEGMHAGTATVYLFRTDGDHLFFVGNPSKMPADYLIEEVRRMGGELEIVEDNPRILLDSGDIVYGCQVWWEFVEPSG